VSAFALVFLTVLSGCDHKEGATRNTAEYRVDSIGADSLLKNGNVEMEPDNTIAKDSASNRKDLGGASE
jgi:hypothetical protein